MQSNIEKILGQVVKMPLNFLDFDLESASLTLSPCCFRQDQGLQVLPEDVGHGKGAKG